MTFSLVSSNFLALRNKTLYSVYSRKGKFAKKVLDHDAGLFECSWIPNKCFGWNICSCSIKKWVYYSSGRFFITGYFQSFSTFLYVFIFWTIIFCFFSPDKYFFPFPDLCISFVENDWHGKSKPLICKNMKRNSDKMRKRVYYRFCNWLNCLLKYNAVVHGWALSCFPWQKVTYEGLQNHKRKVKHACLLIMLQRIACHIRWICFFLFLHYPLYGLTSMLLVASQCGQNTLKSFSHK